MQGCIWGNSIYAKRRGLFSCGRNTDDALRQWWRTPTKWLLENRSSNRSSHHLHRSTDATCDRDLCRAFSFSMIKTDFSKPLLLPSLESSIQMQIALNPINPFRHLYASVSASACVCACVQMHLYTYTILTVCTPSLHPLVQRERAKIVKEENVYFPGYFVRCSCVCLINISYQIFNIIPSPIGSALKCSSKWILP